MYLTSDSTSNIVNRVFWKNSAGLGSNKIWLDHSGSSVDITYSDIDPADVSGDGTSTIGSNCLNADPVFVDDTSSELSFRDYPFKAGSPCIDTGTLTGTPLDDIDGNFLPTIGTGVDIGSDETSDIDNDGDGVFSDSDCYDDDPNI